MGIEIYSVENGRDITTFAIESDGSKYDPNILDHIRYLKVLNLAIEADDPDYDDVYSLADYNEILDETLIDRKDYYRDVVSLDKVLTSGYITPAQAKGEEVINITIRRRIMFATGPVNVTEKYELVAFKIK